MSFINLWWWWWLFCLLSSHFFQFLILYEQYNNNDFDVEMLCCENYFCLIGCREWVSAMEFQITALGLDQIEWCFTPSARGSVSSMSEELKFCPQIFISSSLGFISLYLPNHPGTHGADKRRLEKMRSFIVLQLFSFVWTGSFQPETESC